MITAIVYGRNDAHGYNLHKRAALGLNCLAEVLTGETDELIFVDYNTPDELPTFPEAIADTLTDRCRARLTILRVRPSYHAQFAGQTTLRALECQSRNIAIRRSNPRNRWVLSTNTDMIFCPRREGSLTDAVAGLADGFYHLPRYEAPEGFWERLPRMDPVTAIRAMRRNGRRFHLNEIVVGGHDNLYDAPGDFQLFLRQDLFDIHGFDERMILGWHADSNMARRMRLLRGEVKSATDAVIGYHCGHTRQATLLHGGDRTQNSTLAFVEEVSEAAVPEQALTWGAPDLEVEQIRLDAADHYFSALSRAVTEEGPDFSLAAYNEASQGRTPYSTDHVLPHLCDLLFNLPDNQTILYFGEDAGLLNGLRNFLEGVGKSPRFLLVQEADFPAVEAIDPVRWAGCRTGFTEAIATFDLIVIQLPSVDRGAPRQRQIWEEWCQRALAAVTAVERERPAAERRRVIVVNAINNAFEQLVMTALSPTAMPFSTRLRQGFIVEPYVSKAKVGWTNEELRLLSAAITGIVSGSPVKGWERLAPEIAQIARSAEQGGLLGLSVEGAKRLARVAEDEISACLARVIEPPVTVGPRTDVPTRLCSGADWADPNWSALALSSLGVETTTFTHRSRWTWERVSLADTLIAQLPPVSALRGAKAPRIIFVSQAPDHFIAPLQTAGYEVFYATVDEVTEGADDSRGWARAAPGARRGRRYRPAARRRLRQFPRFAAVILTVPTWSGAARAKVDLLLERIAPDVEPDALLVAALSVQLGGEAFYEGALNFAEWKALFEARGPLGSRGFTPVGAMDARVPLDTVLRFGPQFDSDEPIPALSHGDANSCGASAVLCARWPETLRPGWPLRLIHVPEADREVNARLGRVWPLDKDDRALLVRTIASLTGPSRAAGWERLAPEIAAIAASQEASRTHYGLTAKQTPVVRRLAETAMRAAFERSASEPVLVGPRADIGTRLCSGADWDDRPWSDMALKLFPPVVLTFAQRTRWIWERVSLLHSLRSVVRPGGAPRVLLIAQTDEHLAHILPHLGFETTCATVEELVWDADETTAWAKLNERGWLEPKAGSRPWAARDRRVKFDAVVAATGVIERPRQSVDAILAAAAPYVARNGALYATFAVELGAETYEQALTLAEWQGLYDGAGPLGARGFTPLGGVDDRVPMDTVIRFAPGDDVQATVPGLSQGYDGSFVTTAVAAARWPARLRRGPQARLSQPREDRFDPATVPIPYSAAVVDDPPGKGATGNRRERA